MKRSESTRWGGAAAVIVVATIVLVLLPLIYVALIGPVISLADRGLVGTDQYAAAAIAYRPLEVACEDCEPLAQGIELYAKLWESRP